MPAGRAMRKVVPAGLLDVRVSEPPWASAIHRAIGSPKPLPDPRRARSSCTNRSKIRSRSSGAMPEPSSVTSMAIADPLDKLIETAPPVVRVLNRVLAEIQEHPLQEMLVARKRNFAVRRSPER